MFGDDSFLYRVEVHILGNITWFIKLGLCYLFFNSTLQKIISEYGLTLLSFFSFHSTLFSYPVPNLLRSLPENLVVDLPPPFVREKLPDRRAGFAVVLDVGLDSGFIDDGESFGQCLD